MKKNNTKVTTDTATPAQVTAATNTAAPDESYGLDHLWQAVRVLRGVSHEYISDLFPNDATPNYHATVAAIAECREILGEIEVSMQQELERNAAWHRDNLNTIASLGVGIEPVAGIIPNETAQAVGCSIQTYDHADMIEVCEFLKSRGITTQYSTIFGSKEDARTFYEIFIHCDKPRAEKVLLEYAYAKIERRERENCVAQAPAKREAFADWIVQTYADARIDQLRRRREWRNDANSMTHQDRAKLAVSLAEAEALERELRDLYVCALDGTPDAFNWNDATTAQWFALFDDDGDNLDD